MWKFDKQGNLPYEKTRDGTLSEFSYYPASGETGACQKDPYGFQYRLKRKRISPCKDTNDEPYTVLNYIWYQITGRAGGRLIIPKNVTKEIFTKSQAKRRGVQIYVNREYFYTP